MNELIKELSLQATDSIPDDVSAEHAMYLFQVKFAELIVEEVYDFIMEESANDNGIPDLGKVKEHFGVE